MFAVFNNNLSIYQVPGSVVISARSGSHSFDPSQINVSHYVNQFSFGKKLSPRMFHEFLRLTPYLRGYHDRLAGQSYIVKQGEVNANVTVSLLTFRNVSYLVSFFSAAIFLVSLDLHDSFMLFLD